jgi:hypothetical protein
MIDSNVKHALEIIGIVNSNEAKPMPRELELYIITLAAQLDKATCDQRGNATLH